MSSSKSSHRETVILHGSDYNPEQWLRYDGIIDEDFRLIPQARLNALTVGIFSWAALEPSEGIYCFDWLDDIFERAAKQDIRIVLATPSGAKPNWLALAYPEVRRVNQAGAREPQGIRHNHCLTSPVYRRKVAEIDTQISKRYGRHEALTLWHLSNEYGGYCYCPLCFQAFRDWLRQRYGTIDALNDAYWARFWSHTFASWDEITFIDPTVHGLELDWKRFMTHQCRTFLRAEADAVRQHSPGIPVTTNLMRFYEPYNYWELAKELDVVSWDSYPFWHSASPEFDESEVALGTAFNHDVFRSMKQGRPFLLMENSPSQINWTGVSPLKRPGVHRLSAVQAVAHGADAFCYFQFRKSRGSTEKFHGAVVDHGGGADTRVFREVAATGEMLSKISGVVGGTVPARAAILFDWENQWALERSMSPQNTHKEYIETALDHYRPLWKRGVAVDIIDQESDLSPYQLVIAPMLYMVRGDLGERLAAFVKNGGTLVGTYCSGIVNETDLCFLGGAPGPLREVFGLRVEESDALPNPYVRKVRIDPDAGHGLQGTYEARHYLDLIHPEGATVLARYAEDFYAEMPALTLNRFHAGRAFYVASRNDRAFIDDFLGFLARDLGLAFGEDSALPAGVTVHRRQTPETDFYFFLNFRPEAAEVCLVGLDLVDAETGEKAGPRLALAPYGAKIMKTPRLDRAAP